MAAETFKEKYESYQSTLQNLKSQCTQAEKNAIVAETNLKTLQEQRTKLIEECEQFAGVSIDKVPAMLESKKKELDEIMSKLATIDISGDITEDTVADIESIVTEYNIAAQEE